MQAKLPTFLRALAVFSAILPCAAFAEGAAPAPVELPSAVMAMQEGTAAPAGSGVTLSSTTGKVVLIFQPKTAGTFDTVSFRDAIIPDGSAIFLWKPKGAEFSQQNQMTLQIRNGRVSFPEDLDTANFDFFGFALFTPRAEFSDIEVRKSGFSDHLADFLTPELVKPWTVNLLYGAKWGNVPYVKILGILLIVVASFFLIAQKPQLAAITVLAAWMLFDLRYAYDQYSVVRTTYRDFVTPANAEDKQYYDFGNFYGFVDKARECLPPDAKGVNFYAPASWPFQVNFLYHVLPVRSTWQTTDQPYYAVFANAEVRDGKKFYWQGKEIDPSVSVICRFASDSYILRKNP
jgi:hypothetical protein